MPNPTARPPEPARKAPDSLDELVRAAMRGGGTDKLRAALEKAGEAADAAPTVDLVVADRPAATDRLVPPAVDFAGREPATPSDRWQDRMVRAARQVLAGEGDEEAVRAALLDVEDALSDGFSSLPEPSPTLPPIRQPWLLLVPPGGDPERIAWSLGVDHATARLLCQGRWPRVGLRGASPDLGRVRTEDQVVVARDELLAVLVAFGVLVVPSPDEESGWIVTAEPIWLADSQGGGTPARLHDVWLIVAGEVETRSTREAPAENRWLRNRLAAVGAGTERRIRIVDLHTKQAIFRLVEGNTRMVGVPGYDPLSARRSLAGVLDHLCSRYPGAQRVEERVCGVGADGRSAWPQWEEHTRVVRTYFSVRAHSGRAE